MKENKLDKMMLNEALWGHLAAFAVEEIIRAGGIGLRSSLSESEFLDLFQKKYSKAIKVAERSFSDELVRKVSLQPPEFFSIESIKDEISTRRPDSLRESCNMGNGILSRLIFENSIKYARGGLGDPEKLVTSQVEFEWGKYNYPDPNDANFKNKSKIASANYWIKEGESNLGDIQFKGDPFTYTDAGGGSLEVISGPGSTNPITGRSYRESIGSVFSTAEKDSELGGSDDVNLEAMTKFLKDQGIAPSEEEVEEAESRIADKVVSDLQKNRKEKLVKSIKEGFDIGEISVIAWSALDEQAGVDDFINSFIYNAERNIFRQGLIKTRPEICYSRLGMVMVILAEKIDILGRKSIKNFRNQKDPIFEMLFTLADEDLDPENLLGFLYYIEAIKNKIVEAVLEKYVPIANLSKYGEDDADKPANYLSAFFSDRDKCGYLVDPDSEGEYGRPDNTLDIARSQEEMRELIRKQKEQIRAELQAKKKREEDERREMDREIDLDTDREVPEARDEEAPEEEIDPDEIERMMQDRGYSM